VADFMFNWTLKLLGRRLVSLERLEQERAEARRQAGRLEHEREKVRKLKASLEAATAKAEAAAQRPLRKLRRRAERATIGGVLENLRGLDWRPGAIIDIGVADGTPGLYDVWPDAPLCLVEPSPDALPLMQRIARQRPGVQIFNVGASNRSGTLQGFRREGAPYVVFVDKFVKPRDRMAGASFPIMTCDEIVTAAGIEGPYLLKLDTDAHELEVLEGAVQTLANTDLCIVEMQVFHPLRARPGPDALWRFLNDHGLVFFDIAEICYAPSGVMRIADLVFVRQESPLYLRAFERRDKHDGIVRHAAEFARRAAAAGA
jgi:FkbM family methyltransferase